MFPAVYLVKLLSLTHGSEHSGYNIKLTVSFSAVGKLKCSNEKLLSANLPVPPQLDCIKPDAAFA